MHMERLNYIQKEKLSPERDVQDGLIFIPDISGFTGLVHSTDVLTGKQITYELLSALIGQNDLQLSISEVEGDAVLFYRFGPAPSLCDLAKQYKNMMEAFENKKKELEVTYSMPLNLSLKVIAHYGPMTEYTIGPFKKLYGEVVVEAHRLLKNSIGADSSLLMTDALQEMTGGIDEEELLRYGIQSEKLCEVYGSLKIVCFTYWHFDTKKMLEVA